jgi:hypothetical protein
VDSAAPTGVRWNKLLGAVIATASSFDFVAIANQPLKQACIFNVENVIKAWISDSRRIKYELPETQVGLTRPNFSQNV